jgi:hypothetical protein
MLIFILGLIVIALILVVSWAITIGVIWLICLCFSWEFNLLIATGIWLILMLLSSVFGGRSKSE